MSTIRAYYAVFRMRWKVETQYRAAALGGVFCQLFFGLMLIALYNALYQNKQQDMPLATIVTYVWLQQSFFRMLLSNDNELSNTILTGGMAYEIVRPMTPYWFYYMRALAQKIVGTALRAAPMLAVACVLPSAYRIGAPVGLPQFLCFLLGVGLGLICVCALTNIGMAFTIRSLDGRGIQGMLNLMICSLAGNILPLTLFPDSWQRFLAYSPFTQLLDTPIRVYTGAYAMADVPRALAIQAIWAVILILIGMRMWRSNLKRIIVQGG